MIVFTSLRSGDLEIYTMDQGREERQAADQTSCGYDGGPFWSQDGKLIVYRAFHPQTEAEKADYTRLLTQDLIRPSKLDLYVMNPDGTNKRRDHQQWQGQLRAIPLPGQQTDPLLLEPRRSARTQLRHLCDQYRRDGSGADHLQRDLRWFPDVLPDGKKVVFCSNRNAAKQGDTNVFIADWVEVRSSRLPD
jgi:Tol biopolymer transport system component